MKLKLGILLSNVLLSESLLKLIQVRVSVPGSRSFQLESGSHGSGWGEERA